MIILHVLHSLTIGGAETLLTDLSRYQSEHNEVHILSLTNHIHPEIRKSISDKVTIHFLNRKNGKRNLLGALQLNYLIWQIHPDIIHCHQSNNARAIIYPKKKLFLTRHMNYNDFSYLGRFNRIIAVSASTKHYLESHTRHQNIDIVENGIDTTRVVFKEMIIRQPTLRIVMLGHLVGVKEHSTVIKAIAHLTKRNKVNLHLDIIGDGPCMKELQKQVNRESLTDIVTFLGKKDRNFIYQNLCNYDLLIQASTTEAMPLTVIEAMVAGVPVLVSDIDSLSDITEEGRLGTMFKVKDHLSCANAIYNIINRYEECASKALLAREKAIKEYDIRITTERYIEIYRKYAF